MVLYKTNVRRRISIDKRDIYGLTSRDIIDLHPLLQCIVISSKTLKTLMKMKRSNNRCRKVNRVKQIIQFLCDGIVNILRIHAPINENTISRRKQDKIPPRTVFDFAREGFSDQFRFHSPEDILRLIEGLGFPPVIKIKGYKLHAQEIVLISLKRLAYPLRWSDIKRDFPGRSRTALRYAFYFFLDFCKGVSVSFSKCLIFLILLTLNK